jgi:hypothetical protein
MDGFIMDRVCDESEGDYPEGCGTIIKRGSKYDYVRWDISGKVTKHEADSLGTMGDNAGHSPVMLYAHLKAVGHSEVDIQNWIDHPEWKSNCRKLRNADLSHLKGAVGTVKRRR